MKLTLAITLLVALPSLAFAVPAPIEAPEAEAVHHSAPDPVAVVLAASGAPTLGDAFTLRATLTAQWRDLPDVAVELSLPEALSATGATSAVVDLAKDAPLTLEFILTPTSKGTHELKLTASAEVAESAILGGSRMAFAVVPAEGPGAFYQDLLPQEPRTLAAPVPAEVPFSLFASAPAEEGAGPLAATPPALPPEEPHASLETGAPEGGEGGPSILGHSTFQVKVCWYYESEAATPVDMAQRYATIQVKDEDDFFDDLLAEGVTGEDGCYTSGSISREDEDGGSGNQDIYVRILLCNTWVCTQDSNEDFYAYRVDHGTVGSEDLLDLGGFKGQSGDQLGQRAFQYANNGVYFAVNHILAPGFSGSGPQVTLWAPSTDGNCPGMFLRRSENRIHVCSDSDRSPEDVGHEVGHWVQWNLYGQSFWPSPGGAHNLCGDPQVRGLSWTEGWGNFYAPRVGNEVSASPSDGNINYDRPWDGSSFSINMETATWCGASVAGDDNEMNVAQSLWDIRDGAVDGVDTGSATGTFMAAAVAACDSDNFRDFFDGGGCDWITQGGSACTFMRAAFQNNIDFDDNAPTVGLTSQGAFVWESGTMGISATAADADTGCTPSVEFRVSHDSTCNQADTDAGTDPSSPYSVSFDTTGFTDDGSVWTCARSSDGIETSGWDTSVQIGIDNTDPVVSLSVVGTAGNAGWYTSTLSVTVLCSDGLSGVDDIWYSLDGGAIVFSPGPIAIVSEGVHTLAYACSDNAGNADFDGAILRIDTLDPTTTPSELGAPGENGWYVGDVTIGMTCTDPTPGSGCFGTQIAVTSPGGAVNVFDYTAPFVLTGDGVHTVDYHSVDVAGNVEPTGSFDIAIDTAPPTGEITSATDGVFTHDGAYVLGGLFTNAATLTVSYHAADAASGLQLVSTTGDSDAYTGELDVNGALVLTLPPGLSTWTLTAEDMAGHTASLGTFSVVSIPPGTYPGGVAPRSSGWWKNVVRNGDYTQAQLDAMLILVNAASHSFGSPDDRWAPITPANFATYLQSNPPTANERVRKEDATAWLNLVSGREPAAQAVDLASVANWQTMVTNTGGSSLTTALNVVMQVEKRLTESPINSFLNSLKSLLSSLNSGGLNV